jgi:hypothetical protein
LEPIVVSAVLIGDEIRQGQVRAVIGRSSDKTLNQHGVAHLWTTVIARPISRPDAVAVGRPQPATAYRGEK